MSIITCTDGGAYPDALTVGNQYEMLDFDEDENQVRVKGDNDRTRWFPASIFDLDGEDAVLLEKWEFDFDDFDAYAGNVEVNIELNDGSQRWALFVTPTNLGELLTKEDAEPAFQGRHIVFVNNLEAGTINRALRYLEREERLLESTLPLS